VNAKGEIKQVKLFQTTLEDIDLAISNDQNNKNKLSSDKQTIRVECADGVVVIHELQLEGKKRMSARDWLVGNSVSDWAITD
jgi:methionyl-tRNA formyltransferase